MNNFKLLSFHTIEGGSKEDFMITWSFPTLSEQQRLFLYKKVFTFKEDNIFYYLRLKEWLYIKEFHSGNNKLGAICIIATDYDYPKYEILCKVLVDKYLHTTNPVELTKLYLSFCTQMPFQENGTSLTKEFKMLSRGTCNIKEMIKGFGPEIILIFTALLFKKRIIVYHSNLALLQEGLLCISKLMPFRDPNDFLYPNIEDGTDFQGKTFFVVGTLSEKLHLNPASYELYINLANLQISITPQAKEMFIMTKIQKDIAMFLIEIVEKTDINDTHILAEIKTKTQELIDNLNTLATVKVADNYVITMECLRERRLNLKTENFLFNLAVAENMMML